MSEKRKILIQLDSDPHPSVFDRVVAIDSGADEVFSYGGVRPEDVQALVHGAIFTRGPKDLHRTALFIGGSDLAAGEQLAQAARKAMVPAHGLQVSILLDSNGANTTAAAAVLAAARHLSLQGARALVLGGTGPVGQRVALLLALRGAEVRLASRSIGRARAACEALAHKVPQALLEPAAGPAEELLAGRSLVVSTGAAGVVLLPGSAWQGAGELQVVVDLNAYPPAGVEGVEVLDRGAQRHGKVCYGAIGVGGLKMKLHRKAVTALFEKCDQMLDAAEVLSLGGTITW
jgi:hypothetical protein